MEFSPSKQAILLHIRNADSQRSFINHDEFFDGTEISQGAEDDKVSFGYQESSVAHKSSLPSNSSEDSNSEVTDLFARRSGDYRANIHRCGPNAIQKVLQSILGDLDQLAISRGFPLHLLPNGPHLNVESDDPVDPIDQRSKLLVADAALTGCAVAVAETGTIILDGGNLSGRRILSLLPDRHVCVVYEHQIVLSLKQGLAQVRPSDPITLVSGPSATSDIELVRVEGVHGPRTLDIIISGTSTADPKV